MRVGVSIYKQFNKIAYWTFIIGDIKIGGISLKILGKFIVVPCNLMLMHFFSPDDVFSLTIGKYRTGTTLYSSTFISNCCNRIFFLSETLFILYVGFVVGIAKQLLIQYTKKCVKNKEKNNCRMNVDFFCV